MGVTRRRTESSSRGLRVAQTLGPAVVVFLTGLLILTYRQVETPTPWLLGCFVVGLVATPFVVVGIQKRSVGILVGCAIWLQLAGYFVNYHFYSGVGLRGLLWVERLQQLSAMGLPILTAISLFNIFWPEWFLGSDKSDEDDAPT